MKRFTEFKTISGKKIRVSSNNSRRTFTIVTTSGKYRTYPMDKQEFISNSHNTGNDWSNFLKGSDYFPVK